MAYRQEEIYILASASAPTTESSTRPAYDEVDANYPVSMRPERVFSAIGGKVEENSKLPEDQGKWKNSCAVRLSDALNKSGAYIPKLGGETVSGGTGHQYIYRVSTMEKYLSGRYGSADSSYSGKYGAIDPNALKGIRGIIMFRWGAGEAQAHFDLYNGTGSARGCTYTCYFDRASEVKIWKLP